MEVKILYPIKPNQRLKVAAYARISGDKEASEPSLEEQIDHYTRLIIQNKNWDYAGVYFDKDVSGTDISKRKGFVKMIEQAKAGNIDLILVKSLSRFARNVLDILAVIRELRNKGVEIYFEDIEMSSLNTQCDQALTIYAKFAEMEATTSSERKNWGLDVDRKNGKYYLPVNHMMGYRFDNDKNIVIHNEEAKTIRLIYQMYLEGYGTVTIANYLKTHGYINRRGLVSWSVAGINRILTNEKYIGNCLLQKTFTRDPLTKKKVYNHGQKKQYLIEGGHPAIIDKETFNRVQDTMEKKRKQYKLRTYENTENYNPEYIRSQYTGFFLCPHCGKNYVIKTNHYNGVATKKFLTCNSNMINKTCKSENYPLDTVKEMMGKQIKILKSNIFAFKEALKDVFKPSLEDNHDEEINAINGQIEDLRNKYETIKDFQDDYFTAIKNDIVVKINELVEQRTALQNQIVSKEEYDQRINNLLDAVKSFPDEYEGIGDTNYRSIFSNAVVVNKDLIYFIIGNSDIKLPLKPKLLFKSSIEYKVRLTTFTTQFGILINK